MVDGVGVTKYTYSAVSQLLSEDGPWSNDTITYGYTAMQRTSLSLQQPTSTWTNGFTYDNAKRLTSVTSPAGAFAYYYDAVRSTLPDAIAPQLQTQLTFKLNVFSYECMSSLFDNPWHYSVD